MPKGTCRSKGLRFIGFIGLRFRVPLKGINPTLNPLDPIP